MLIWIGRLGFFYIFWRSIGHPGWAILRCHIDIYVPWTVRLWNFLPEECFPLTYDLKSLNSNCIYGVNLIKIITVKPILDHAYVCMDPLQLIQEKKNRQKNIAAIYRFYRLYLKYEKSIRRIRLKFSVPWEYMYVTRLYTRATKGTYIHPRG